MTFKFGGKGCRIRGISFTAEADNVHLLANFFLENF
jgi:hypothetical protein